MILDYLDGISVITRDDGESVREGHVTTDAETRERRREI